MAIVDISGLNDLPDFMAYPDRRRRISSATKVIGNYAYFPGLGWHRYWTLADATHNQYLY